MDSRVDYFLRYENCLATCKEAHELLFTDCFLEKILTEVILDVTLAKWDKVVAPR
jgi:hypothetical protein